MTASRTIKSLLPVTAASILLLVSNPVASGQTGITVTPTRIAPTIAVGGVTRETVTISNASLAAIEVKVNIDQPEAGDGTAAISATPETVSLGPGESFDIEVQVAVPDSANAGGQSGSVSFNVTDTGNSNVAIVGKIRVAIDLNVIEPVSDIQYSYPQLVTSSDPVVFTMEGRNTGYFPASIAGRVELGGLFGDDIVLESSSGQVDNDETFDLQVVWEKPPLIGIRKATIILSSGVGAPKARTTYILIFSWKLMLLIIPLVVPAFILSRKVPAINNVFQRKWRQ